MNVDIPEPASPVYYCEQITSIATELAGFSLHEADLLRKAIQKKMPLDMWQRHFVNAVVCRKPNISFQTAERLFGWMAKSNGPNYSHLIAYLCPAPKQVANSLATAVVARLLRDLNDSNPDIGMPPSDEMYVRRAIIRLGLTEFDVDMNEVLGSIRKR